jgi:predicted permease
MALAAGGLGMLLGQWAGSWLQSALGALGDAPPMAEYGLDWRVFGFTAGVALVAGVLAALLPALRGTRLDVLPLLKDAPATTTSSRRSLRSALVVGQVVLACLVLVAASLAVLSTAALGRVDLGFQPANLLLASYDLDLQRYVVRNGVERAQRFHAAILERVRALPGVRSASLAAHVPFDVDQSLQGSVVAEGAPAVNDPHAPVIPVEAVDHDYLRTMGIRVVAGRGLAATDRLDAPRVAIINEALSRRLWPDGSAVGKRILIGGGQPLEVVGVVGNGRYMALADQGRPHVFLPLAQNFRGGVTVVVRTEVDPLALASAIGRIVREMEPDLPLFNIRTMEQQLKRSSMGLMPMRFGASFVGMQAVLVLVLTVMGLYGLVSFEVARRTREIAVRVALGAGYWDAVRLAIRHGLTLTLVGVVVGLPLAYIVVQPLGKLLYGASPQNVLVYTGVALLVGAVTLVACWLPARRAAKVDPMVALRCE